MFLVRGNEGPPADCVPGLPLPETWGEFMDPYVRRMEIWLIRRMSVRREAPQLLSVSCAEPPLPRLPRRSNLHQPGIRSNPPTEDSKRP